MCPLKNLRHEGVITVRKWCSIHSKYLYFFLKFWNLLLKSQRSHEKWICKIFENFISKTIGHLITHPIIIARSRKFYYFSTTHFSQQYFICEVVNYYLIECVCWSKAKPVWIYRNEVRWLHSWSILSTFGRKWLIKFFFSKG